MILHSRSFIFTRNPHPTFFLYCYPASHAQFCQILLPKSSQIPNLALFLREIPDLENTLPDHECRHECQDPELYHTVPEARKTSLRNELLTVPNRNLSFTCASCKLRAIAFTKSSSLSSLSFVRSITSPFEYKKQNLRLCYSMYKCMLASLHPLQTSLTNIILGEPRSMHIELTKRTTANTLLRTLKQTRSQVSLTYLVAQWVVILTVNLTLFKMETLV